MKKGKIVVLLVSLIILSQISLSFSLSEYNLSYDANGNLIQGYGKYYEYNGFNQLKQIREDNFSGRIIQQYFYDSEGNRIIKIQFNSDGSNETVYYIGKDFIQIINNSGVFNETYYYDESDLVAKKDNNGKMYYYHPDQLGSTNIVTNESGDIIENTSYLPYGEIIEGGNSRFLFTGKEKDSSTGLYYYGARYYDPFFKHFTQPDPVIGDIYNPQDLNRYSYVRNNPYKYTDPSGNSPTLVTALAGLGIGAAIGALVSIGTQYYNTGQVNLGDVGKSATIGAVAGGVAGLTLGLGNLAIGAAGLSGASATIAEGGITVGSSVVSGQVARGTSNFLEGESFTTGLGNAKDISIDVGIGLATFGLGKSYQSSYIKNSWSQATFESPEQNMKWHYNNYATKMSELRYTQKSQNLFNDYMNREISPNEIKTLKTNFPLRDGSSGTKITLGNGDMGIFTSRGKTITYHSGSS